MKDKLSFKIACSFSLKSPLLVYIIPAKYIRKLILTDYIMKTLIQITLTLFAVFILYLFIYWKIIFKMPAARNVGLPPNVISLLIAIFIGILLWKQIGSISNSLPAYIIAGGVIIGIISFILGFFGPMILMPDNNLGPVIGIIGTGPLGFVVGLFAGGLYWKKVQHK